MISWYNVFRVMLYSGFAISLYVFYTVVYLDPCQRVQTYSIREVFPENTIEKWRLEELLWSVEDMWEEDSNLELFRYTKSGGDISVSLIIDPTRAQISSGERFEKGSHFRGNIEIYHYENEVDLIKVLTHEFGHALDLGHVAGDESVMAATFLNRTTWPLRLTEFDMEEFRNECRKLQ